jgi:hypothetical protein
MAETVEGTQPRWRRVAAAFVVAPFVPGLVSGLLLSVFAGDPGDAGGLFRVAANWMMLALIFTLPATLVLGVPLFLIYRRLGWTAWWAYALGGAGIGALCVLTAPAAITALLYPTSGAVAALTLWCGAHGNLRALATGLAALLGLAGAVAVKAML